MIRKLSRRLGAVKTAVVVTAVSILLSLFMYVLACLFLGRILFVGLLISAVIPALITPFLSYIFLRVLVQLDIAEEVARKNRKKYQELVDRAPTGIYEFDVQTGRIVTANDFICILTGYSKEELLKLSSLDLLTKESKKRFIESAQKPPLEKPASDTEGYNIKCKDDREVPVLLNSRIIYADGQPKTATVVVYDISERKRVEDELKAAEERYKQLINNAQDIIYRTDFNGHFTFVNPTAVKVMGYSEKELVGKHFSQLIHPEYRTQVERFYESQFINRSNNTYYELPVFTKEGKDVWIGQNVQLITKNDKVVGFQAVARDITERVNVEQALRESEERYRKVLENIEDGYYEVDNAGKFIFFNDSFTKIVGYSKDELMGKSYRQYIPPHTAKTVFQTFNRVYTSGKPVKGFEWEFVTKKGMKRYLEVSISLVNDSEGNKIGFRGIVRDATERKEAEQALRLEKERFRVLVEQSPLSVTLIGRDGRYKYLNPKFEEVFGYTIEDVPTGRHWFRKAFPDANYRTQVISTWLNDFKKSRFGESRAREFSVKCKDGSEKMIHFRPVTMETGEQFVIYEDITQQRRLEAQLQQAQKMEAMGSLAGGIAHDFNNILAAILGYTQLVAFDLPEGTGAKRNLHEILKSIQRAKDLVNQILTFSRNAGVEYKPINIGLVVEEALKLIRASLPTTIEIHRHIEFDAGVVLADPTQIHQVLMNLCTNAAHAMGDTGGELEVSLTHVTADAVEIISNRDLNPGAYLKLTVKDTGHGMDRHVLERIFDPYFTTKEKAFGTGLGLATTHGIVKDHGGAITVHSEPGKGATFNVYFPLIETEMTPEEDIEEPLPMGHERVLFIDDEPVLTELGKQMLQRLGYNVVTRTSSIEALELFRAKPDQFDLVFTDMTMPQMTGEQLAGELMEIRTDIPVILCTGYSERITEEKAKKKGIKALAMKPIVIQELASLVRKVLDER